LCIAHILSVMPTNLVTKREAAELLGVHPSTVQRMIPHDLKPAVEFDGPQRKAMYMFKRSDVERLAAKRAA
jgi:excisionase family DNA binding protein